MAVSAVTLRAFALVALTIFGIGSAEAASCRAMKAELASYGSKTRDAARYRSALERQRGQMKRVEALMHAHSCRTRRSSACTTLRTSYRDMERNLRTLKRKSVRPSRKARLRLQRRIASRCDGVRKTAPRRQRAAKPERRTAVRRVRRSRRGTWRTMCVRTCDGFAFPVSLSTKSGLFDRDAKSCAARCPGVETRLFAVPSGQAGLTEARDVQTDAPYADLPNAFRYREVFDRSCSCRANRSKALDYGRPIASAAQPARTELKPARDVRIVGEDYFANR